MSNYNYSAFADGYEISCNQCCPPPRPVRPCPPPQPQPCCVGPRGPEGKSAYQIALANGFVGTEVEWLESLKAQAEPFRSCYLEVLGNRQAVAANANIVFDASAVDAVGTGITVDATGTIFTITRPGLYHVEWNVNVAPGPTSATPAIIGILENGAPASGAMSSAAGGFSSGTLIQVTNVPFTLSLRNYLNPITLETPDNWTDGAASIRILRFADGAIV